MFRAFKIIYPLVVIGVGVGFLLSFTYQSLEKRLIEAKNREEMFALKQLFPNVTNFKKLDIKGEEYYEAVGENQQSVGYIFKRSNTGYGGPVEALVAITNGFVANIVVTSMAKETPGLGSKIADKNWLKQFLGKGPNEIPSTKIEFKEKGIDAVSGATFSSLAICKNILDAFKTYKKLGFIVNENNINGETRAAKEE